MRSASVGLPFVLPACPHRHPLSFSLPQIASQGDTSLFDTPPPSGFLKTIFPCLRKGGSGHQGSMAWVKLVDDEGRVAGHAVLSARISMALLGGQVRWRWGWAASFCKCWVCGLTGSCKCCVGAV